MRIEAKLEKLGLVLPEPMQVPPDLRMPFSWEMVLELVDTETFGSGVVLTYRSAHS